MDKTDQIGNAIYTSVMKRLLEELIEDLDSNNIETEDASYVLRKRIFNNLNTQEKKHFVEYIESILEDCTTTVLAGLEGETHIDLYPCESIELSCDGEKIDPYLTDIFKGLIEDS